MTNSMNQEVMKTISTRLSSNDAELFLSICEEYNLTQSEAIRCLIQAFISKIFNSNHSQVKELFSIQDFDAFKRQKETEKFYKNFKIVNQKELSRP
jgi:antitoxin component of RelBE/YafQ-DinJ toxin-antitoxin module